MITCKCHLSATWIPLICLGAEAGELLAEVLSSPGPGRLLAVGVPVEIGLSNLGEPRQLQLLRVVEVGQDGDLAVEVDKVLCELVLPHCLAHLIEQVVAALRQLEVAVKV